MFYAVHKGHKPGIYGNWLDCKKQIDKYEGIIFNPLHKHFIILLKKSCTIVHDFKYFSCKGLK